MNGIGWAPRWLKPAVDDGPLAMFFASYLTLGQMAATAALIAASLIARWVAGFLEPLLPLVTAAIVVVFGGPTSGSRTRPSSR